MPKNSLLDRVFFRMLFSLDAKRRQDFAAYISLRQFNANAGLVALLEIVLGKYSEQRELAAATIEDLASESGMAVTTIEKSLSQMLSLLHDFVLVHAALKEKEHVHNLPFAAWMAEGLSDELLEREFRRRLRLLQKLPESDLNLHEELLLEHSRAKLAAAKPRKDQGNLVDRHIQLLDNYYNIARLRYVCAYVNAARIFGNADPTLHEISISDADFAQLPKLAQTYAVVLKLLRSETINPEAIAAGLCFLQTHESHFAIDDRTDLYGYLLNTGVRGMVTGKPAFNDIVFLIYDALLKNGLLLEGGTLSGSHFKNIVTIMVRTHRLAEGRIFIAEYAGKLVDAEREMIAPYCMGIIEFHSGNFREAIKQFSHLLALAPEDQFWSLEVRSVLWKAYFEALDTLDQQEYEEMLRLYHSFRNFVSRSKQIAEHHRTGYLNFIRLFNRLIQLSESQDQKEQLVGFEALLEKALSMEKVINKAWVLATIRKKIVAIQAALQ